MKALLAAPTGEATRLVFPDWLEEQGDRRAEVVRSRPEVFHFLASLKTAEDVPSDWLRERVEAGEADLLAPTDCGVPAADWRRGVAVADSTGWCLWATSRRAATLAASYTD